MNTSMVRTMNRFLRSCLALLFAAGLMASAVTATFAQIERQISYQGLLTLPNGLPLDDGQYDLVMRLYDAPVGGNLLWEETQQTILTKGLFNVYLGSVVPLNGVDFFNTQAYLETALAGQPPFPRTRLAVVPYAIRAERAGLADSISITAGGFVRSLNDAEGKVVIAGRNGIAVTRNGDTISIESTITLMGIQNLSSPQSTIEIGNPSGPNTTVDIRDGAVTAIKIADSTITTNKLVDSLITEVKIADGAVTLSKIAPGVIPTSLPPRGPAGGDLTGTYPNPTIALGAVTGPKLADGAVSTPKIADGAITTTKLVDNSITTTKIVDGAVTTPKLSSTGVSAGTYGDALNIPRITVDDKGRVTLISVAPLTNFPFIVAAGGDLTGTYPDPFIRTNAVTTSKILDFNVTTSKLADQAVTTPKIAIGAVRSEQVADGSLTVIDLAPGTIPTTLPPSGPATGDLAGFYPSPTLSTAAGAGSRMVTALRTNFIAGDVNVNTANNIVMLNSLGQFPAANGNLITSLNVNNVSSGILAVQFGGTNSSTPLNNNRIMISSGGRIVEAAQQSAGQFLIGTGPTTAPAVGQIIAGTGMTVTYATPNIIIASTTQPGTANDQTLRWDVASNAWIPTSNILSSAAGNLTVNGNTTLGDAPLDQVRFNAATVGIPNIPTTTTAANVLIRNAATGNVEVSTANFSTSTVPLAANTAVRTNAAGQLESVVLANGQLLIGSAGIAPQAATLTGTTNRVIVTNGPGSITLSLPQDIATTSNVNFNTVTTANNAVIGTGLQVGGAAQIGGTLLVTGGTTLNSSLTQSNGQVVFGGNVDANNGLDVVGPTTMNGALTQSGGQVTFSGNVDALGGLDVAGLTTMSGAVTQTTGQVTFGGNVDANAGLDVTGLTTLAGNVTQTGGTVTVGGATTINNSLSQSGGQVTFGGNVDANAGLDVLGSNLTVGGANFTVNPANGNVTTAGSILANGSGQFNTTLNVGSTATLSGNVLAGDGNGDNVTINTAGGGVLRMTGLPNVAGADVLMISATNDVSRFPITGLIGADEGLTYNEAGSARVRLGAVNATTSTMTGNRFVNLGNNDLRFTTNAGNSTALLIDGDATNFSVDLFAAGTGAIDLNGTTRIVGATTVTGTVTQTGGQVILGSNVDANAGLDVLGSDLTVGGSNFTVSPTTGNVSTAGTVTANGAATLNSTLAVAGTATMNGNVVAGNGTGDNVTINTAGGGALSMVGLPVAAGVDVLMANGANIITRTPINTLINADQALTYNEGGLGFVRLGSPNNLGSTMTMNRFVNIGNFDLRFTTNGGAVNLVTMDGDAVNYGVAINAAGTGSITLTGSTVHVGPTTFTGTVTQGSGQVVFNGNVDANSGLDVTGLTTLSGNVTQSAGTVTIGGATTVNNTLTQTGPTNQVTFAGNVDANNGVDVVGATTLTGAVTQSGGQATFNGNVDAMAGLDVTGQDLTVGGANFMVSPLSGNTSVNGSLTVNGATTLNGNVTMGNGTSDNVVIDVSGGAGTLRMNGLVAGAGTDLLMINATNIVSRTPLANLIDADQGVTYNEAGSARMRLGSTTNVGVPFATNRFINIGNNDLTITTNAGAQNLVLFDGDATNAGVTVAPSGAGRFVVNGGSNLNGAVTMTNTVTQTGTSQVTFGGNVDANNGLDVTGQNFTVGGTRFTVAPATGNTVIGGTADVTGAAQLGSTLTVAGNTTLNGNVVAGNGNGDDVTIDVSGAGGVLTINGLPVVAGTEVLMSNAANVITKTPLVAIIDANQGITYNEDGTGKVRLGGTTNAVNPFAVDRFVNLGNFDLRFTTSAGANNILVLDGGALNYGATVNAGGTGSIALNGPTNITGATSVTGATTITGTVTQNGSGQVTFSGNVDANNGLDVSGAFTVAGNSTLTGNLNQSAGTVTLGGATTIGGATNINNTLAVSGATTLSSSLRVDGNTTLGDAAADNVTVNAATVTMANLPTATTVNKFIMSGTGGALQVREINNIVTGTGTPNRLTRWDATGAGILDASLSDDGAGVLSRSGNVSINPGAAFTLSTNGNFSVSGTTTLTGTATMNGAVNIGNGADAVAVNVTGSQLTLTGIGTAVGTDVLMANGVNVVSRTPITSLIGADQGLSYNESGSAKVRLGTDTRGQNTITGNRFVDIGTTGRLIYTTNGGSVADDMLTLSGGAANYGVSLRSKGTGAIAMKAGDLNGVGDVTTGTLLNMTTLSGAQFKYFSPDQEMGIILEQGAREVIISAEDITAGEMSEIRVKGSMVEISGPIYQATPDLVQFSGDVELARKLDVVGNFAVNGNRFMVTASNGNTAISGALSVNGSVNLGDGAGADAVTVNVTGSNLKLVGIGTVPGTDVLMINATNDVSRTPITNLIGADEGLTYNEGGSAKVRLGGTTNTTNPLTGNRFVNLGNNDLTFTTNNGTQNVVVIDGGATNSGIALNAIGTGSIAMSGTTTVTGASTFTGPLTQTGGAATINGAATFTNSITQTGTGAITLSGNVISNGNVTVNGATTLGDAAGDALVINAGNITANNIPVGTTSTFVTLSGTTVQQRTINNIVTGTGTPSRMTRWITSSTIGDASLDDNGTGTLSRAAGNIAINPGAGGLLTTTGGLTVSGATSLGSTLSVTGAATLSSTLAVTGASNLNGAVTLGNGDADAIIVNSTGGLVINTGAAADLTITESVVSRNGNIAVNTGAGNSITTDGSLVVDVNAQVKGNTTLGDASTDQLTVLGTTLINTGTATASTSIGNATGNFTLVSSGLNITSAGVISDANSAVEVNDDLTVSGATSLQGSLQVAGASTLNGAVTLGNGDADVISVNASGGLVINTAAGADLTITESALTRNGQIDINPGATNNVSTNGSLIVDRNATIRGNANIGDAATDVISITGQTSVVGILSQSSGQVTFGGNVDANSGLDVQGATTMTGTVTQSAGQVVFGGNVDANAGLDVQGATTMAGTVTQSAGQVVFGGNVDANAGLDVNGASTFTGSMTQSGGSVSLSVSGAGNSLTVNGLPAGSVTGATPDDVMLITTATNVVRRRSIADLIGAEQGVSYNETTTDGKLRLGANANNKSLFASDRFINQRDFGLSFTYTDGVALPRTMLFMDNGIVNVAGTVTINGIAGTGTTAIGNGSNLTSLFGSQINLRGVVDQSQGSVTFSTGTDRFLVLTDGAGLSTSLEVNSASGGILATADDGTNLSELIVDPGTMALNTTTGVQINTFNEGFTSIGNTTNGGAVSLLSSGTNDVTVNPGGDLVLKNIDTDATPTQMVTLTGLGQVRVTALSGTADQGVIYSSGKYLLGGANNTQVPFTSDRFININNRNLNFTTTAGTILNLSGSSIVANASVVQSGGTVAFSPGAGNQFRVTGTANINVAGTDATSIGNTGALLTLRGSSVDVTGNVTANNNLTVTGVTNLNGAVNIGNGDADAIVVNTSGAFSLASNSLNISSTGTITDIGTDNAGAVFVDDALLVSGAAGFNGNVRVGAAGSSFFTVDATQGNVATEANLNVKGNVKLGDAATDLIDVIGVTNVTGNTTVKGANILLETTGASTSTALTMSNSATALSWNEGTTSERNISLETGGVTISSSTGAAFTEISMTDATVTIDGNTTLPKNLTVNGNVNLGNSVSLDNVSITAATSITGATGINTTGSGTTTIGNAATGGAVSLSSSGANNITINPGGDLLLQNIDPDAAPTQMLTLTSGGAVRRTVLSGTADQGVIYTNGQYLLGGATSTQVPFTTNRFINIGGQNLNFTTSAGTLVNMTGSTVTVTGNVTQSAGDASFTPGAGKSFSVTGTTTIAGLTNINSGAAATTNIGSGAGTNTILGSTFINATGSAATSIGNTGPLTLKGSSVDVTGNILANNGLTVTGATTLNGAATIGNGDADAVAINTTGTFTLNSSNIKIDANGNISDNVGSVEVVDDLRVSGATTLEGAITQTGGAQVSFSGNVDATNGLDVTNADLTVGGASKFQVTTSGNVTADGSLVVNSNATLGSQNTGTGDNVTVDVRGTTTNGALTVRGLNATGTFADDVLLITGADIVRRRSLSDLIGAEYGITYNEAGNGRMRLGSATSGSTAAENVLGADRFINQGASGLSFTWLDGATTRTMLNAKNGIVTVTGTSVVDGTANLNGNTNIGNGDGDVITVNTAAGTNLVLAETGLTRTGSDIAINTGAGNKVTTNGSLEVAVNATVTGNTTVNGTTTLNGASALNGNTAIGNGDGDVITVNTAAGTDLTLAETGLTRTGSDIAINTGAGNKVTTNGSLEIAMNATVTGNATIGGSTNLGDNSTADNVVITAATSITGATTMTGNTLVNSTGTGTTTVGNSTNGGAVSIASSGSNNITLNPGGDLVLQNIDPDAVPTQMMTLTSTGEVRKTTLSGTADQGVSYTSGKYQLGSSTNAGVPLTQNRFVNASDFTLDFTYNDAGTTRSMFRLNDGEVVVTSPASFRVIGPTIIAGNTQINTAGGDGSTSIGNATGAFTLTSNNLNISSVGVISDAAGDVEINDNMNVSGATALNGAANIGNGDADAVAINTSGNFSIASSHLNVSTAGTITDAGSDNGGAVFIDDALLVSNATTINGATTINNNLTVTGQVKGAGAERLNSAAASNKYAERVKITGDASFKYTITNSQVAANSVVIITLEDYTGPGILSYQIKRPKDGGGNVIPGAIDVYFSQPILTGESVVVNVMVINQ
ncbi:MAG: hypothetical protein RIR53_279 [Bacteroidota bacterium]